MQTPRPECSWASVAGSAGVGIEKLWGLRLACRILYIISLDGLKVIQTQSKTLALHHIEVGRSLVFSGQKNVSSPLKSTMIFVRKKSKQALTENILFTLSVPNGSIAEVRTIPVHGGVKNLIPRTGKCPSDRAPVPFPCLATHLLANFRAPCAAANSGSAVDMKGSVS